MIVSEIFILFRKALAQAWFSRINMQQSIYSTAFPWVCPVFSKSIVLVTHGDRSKATEEITQSLNPTGDGNTLIFV